uniref:Uncharacterized protein n=1 Tax=Arundo donax TaxID=35708 RepID=A0A0A9HL74_ARUDO
MEGRGGVPEAWWGQGGCAPRQRAERIARPLFRDPANEEVLCGELEAGDTCRRGRVQGARAWRHSAVGAQRSGVESGDLGSCSSAELAWSRGGEDLEGSAAGAPRAATMCFTSSGGTGSGSRRPGSVRVALPRWVGAREAQRGRRGGRCYRVYRTVRILYCSKSDGRYYCGDVAQRNI